MIDFFSIAKLKHFMFYNDQPVLIKSCVKYYNQNQIDHDIIVAIDREFSILDNGYMIRMDENNRENFYKHLNENKTIYISDFEHYNDDAKKLVDAVVAIFSKTDVTCHATCHLYMGKISSQSFDPHCDIPCNFIFQVKGKNRAIVYHNRCSDLMATETIAYSERRNKIYHEELKVCLDVVLEPGDVLYIPAKQYHAIIPLEDRISFSIPIVSHENWYNHERRL